MAQKPLKIFIIGPAYPLRGGPARFNENLCMELNAAGHKVSIISYSMLYPNLLFPGSSQFEVGGRAPAGLSIQTMIHTLNPLNWIKVGRYIRQEKPDFILFRFWLPFLAPCLGSIGRIAGKHTTVLALTDNVIPHEKRTGDKILTRYFLKSCDGFITMSQKVQTDLSLFTDNTNKVYSPHPMYETYGQAISKEAARAKLGLGENDEIILFFGLIRHYKGLDLLIEAMGEERIKRRNIKLLIAGEFYNDKSAYLELISKLDLKDQVILHDHFVPDELVPYYFCAANLVAQTYRNATNSGVTMVGYFYEKPMLVTNVGGLGEIVPDQKCGYVVAPDPKAISEKILEYFLNKREEAFTRNVAIEKKKYEWKEFIKVLTNLYRSASATK
jgi:D-inositol-3-phosphate glycosyltransferase